MIRESVIALLLLLGCQGCANLGTPTILTPIPGVTSTERFIAIVDCENGLRAAGLEIGSTSEGIAEESKALKALKVMGEARQKGVALTTLKACAQMIDNADRARAIRAATPK